MTQPKNAQNLKDLIGTLIEQRNEAATGSIRNVFVAALATGFGAASLYGGISPEQHNLLHVIFTGAGAAMTACGAIVGGMAVSDYHRTNELDDKIAELDYKLDVASKVN